MKVSNFDYMLPPELIATHPAEPRDAAKLLAVNRKTGETTHSHFYDLADFLRPDDFLVFNQSKVIPARLFGEVGDKNVEILLIREVVNPLSFVIPTATTLVESGGIPFSNYWRAKAKPGKCLKIGSKIRFSSKLSAEVLGSEDGIFSLAFNLSCSEFWKEIEAIGEMPLPPYILKQRHEKHDERIDKKDYQTIFAKKPGSVAAPTAGLHFTKELMGKIRAKGCDIGFVDLHVGLGTFEPIRTENIEDHKIHKEYFEISSDLAVKLIQAKKAGRRIIAVGTTTVRVLETIFGSNYKSQTLAEGAALCGETDIYIYPGYEFQFVDAMITNFHLPKSSLLLLVSAFWSRDKMLYIYDEAIKDHYRFYSYGDGMLIN